MEPGPCEQNLKVGDPLVLLAETCLGLALKVPGPGKASLSRPDGVEDCRWSSYPPSGP